jgi:creatinine amidohydrolase/Fe(II)-dependent formamide hydrolase-like protein
VADDATFWPWLSWPKFEAWPDRESTVVVVPVAGMADWGLGHALDAEETVLTAVLRDACRLIPEGKKPLVVPPLRFAFGANPACAFAVDQPTAHALIAEVAASIAAAGFRRIALVNASPWNEELCGAAARDLRVGRGLHMFQVHLSAIDLDFHPVRSRSRRKLQTLITALTGAAPEPAEFSPPEPVEVRWAEETVTPLPGPAATVAEAQTDGPAILASSAARLAKLLSDIRERAPLTAKITPV